MNESAKLDIMELPLIEVLEYGYLVSFPGSGEEWQGIDSVQDRSLFLPFGITLDTIAKDVISHGGIFISQVGD